MNHLPAYQELSAVIDALEHDAELFVPEQFVARIRALDSLELLGSDDLLQAQNTEIVDAETLNLIHRVTALQERFDEANEILFARLIASIRSDDRAAFKQFLGRVAEESTATTSEADLGYDALDLLVTGLLDVGIEPEAPQALDSDLVGYQPTPARIVLKLLQALEITSDDVFYDLGSGLGHVPILVNLLAGIRTVGIELEDAYIRYSLECVKKLGLSNVDFIHADARDTAYDDGTIFYLYTPFQGEVLRNVLQKLEARAQQRPIRICTYGPCTPEVSRQPWLECLYRTGSVEGRVGVFRSL